MKHPWPENVNTPPSYALPPAPPPPPTQAQRVMHGKRARIKCAIETASRDSGYHPSDAQTAFLERLLQVLL